MSERRFSRGAIVAGVVFIALGVGVILDQVGAIDLDPGVLLPVTLIVGGVALLATAWRGAGSDAG